MSWFEYLILIGQLEHSERSVISTEQTVAMEHISGESNKINILFPIMEKYPCNKQDSDPVAVMK